MTIGIIAAMAEELEILLKDLTLEAKKEKANMTFHKFYQDHQKQLIT